MPDTGELPYGFAGHELRAFCDGDGQVWIRARDIRHLLGLERSDAWMAQAYPQDTAGPTPGSRPGISVPTPSAATGAAVPASM